MDDPVEWFKSLPFLTRSWFGASLACCTATSFELFDISKLVFVWAPIRDSAELWRLVAPFCHSGRSLRDFGTLINLYLIVQFGGAYENFPHRVGGGAEKADAANAFLFCVVAILLTYPLVNFCGAYVLGAGDGDGDGDEPTLYPLFMQNLIYTVLYLWSRRHPEDMVEINFIPLQGKYLPFAHIGLGLCLGNRINEAVHGCAVGHIYWFLVEAVPATTGKRVLVTPQLLEDFFGGVDDGDGGDEVTAAHRAAATGDVAFLERLADSVGGRANLVAEDVNGWQPLHEAARGGHVEVIEFLADHGADLDARTNGGLGGSPLWWVIDTHGRDHPAFVRLSELGAVSIRPGEER